MKITKARLKELIKEELEKERPRSPGEAPPETLDDLIRRAMAGGIDPYGGGAERTTEALFETAIYKTTKV